MKSLMQAAAAKTIDLYSKALNTKENRERLFTPPISQRELRARMESVQMPMPMGEFMEVFINPYARKQK